MFGLGMHVCGFRRVCVVKQWHAFSLGARDIIQLRCTKPKVTVTNCMFLAPRLEPPIMSNVAQCCVFNSK